MHHNIEKRNKFDLMILLSLILRSLLFFIFALALLTGILDYTNISFKSDKAHQVLLENIKTFTGRNVSIDGDVYLTVSLSPKLLVKKIHIRNINGFDSEDFITVSEARVEVSLLPLLSGIFHLEEIAADQAKINLIQKKDGSHNWSFDRVTRATDTKPEEPKESLKKKRIIKRLSLGVFSLADVSILYKDESRGQMIEQHFERLMIDTKDINKPHAEILGSIQGSPYNLSFESETLHSLTSGQPWLLYGTGEIAGNKTNIEASLQLIEKTIKGNININVKNANLGLLIEKLGLIAGQDATADEIDINTKLHGSDFTELYEQAEIELQLLHGYWKLASAETDQGKELTFNKISFFTSWRKPVELHLDGMINGERLNLYFKTNRLLEFFDEVKKLDIDLKSRIAGTDITLKGTLDLPIKTKQFQLDLTLKGEDLEKLNPILDAELPPFNDFSLTGKLISNEEGFILKFADASIGDTHFQATIIINTVAPRQLWSINLNSRQLQLNDFALDIKDLQLTEKTPAWTSKQTLDEIAALKLVPQLIDIMQTPKMHLNLNLKTDKILSGENTVGKARLQLHLRDNAVSLNNAKIEIPGGSITFSSNLELINNKIIGDAQLHTNKLDYGITARTFDPGSLLDGVISTRVDLEFSGNELLHLLDQASGQIDFALWPKNSQPARALNLWATNLYLILLPELNKKESRVNCLVGLMTLTDGKMKEDFFAIDTTKLWIPGNINVDFQKENIMLSLFPRSKTARFFALQSPIRASGSFSDIALRTNLLDIGLTYLSFVTSPLHVPARWVFGGKPPEDGSAVCEQFFDRDHVESLNKELRKKEQEEIDEILGSDY